MIKIVSEYLTSGETPLYELASDRNYSIPYLTPKGGIALHSPTMGGRLHLPWIQVEHTLDKVEGNHYDPSNCFEARSHARSSVYNRILQACTDSNFLDGSILVAVSTDSVIIEPDDTYTGIVVFAAAMLPIDSYWISRNEHKVTWLPDSISPPPPPSPSS